MKQLLRKLKKDSYILFSKYFTFWANRVYKRWSPLTIAVTGSVGKTTMLHILEQQFGSSAHLSHNANSIYGIAFDLLDESGVRGSRLRWFKLILVAPFKSLTVRRQEKFYIVEIDADRPKEADVVAAWLKPHITMWTSLSESHASNFEATAAERRISTLELIAREFAMVARHTSELVLVDGTDSLMVESAQNVNSNVEQVTPKTTGYKVTATSSEFKGQNGTFTFADPQPKEIALQLGFVEHLLAKVNMPVVYNLSNMRVLPGRSTALKGRDGLRIIDSSYNAHMQSMGSIIGMFADIKAKNKWLVIGDIIEQGSKEADLHASIASLIELSKPHKVVLVGRRTQEHTYPALKKSGKVPVESFAQPLEALKYLQSNLVGKEVVLFKGSQYLEGIIQHLLADDSDAQKLCRRGAAAQKARRARGL